MENSVNAEQAAVVEQQEGAAVAAEVEQTETSVSGVATQSHAANRAFAEIRRRAEQAERQLQESQNANERLSRLVGQQYGYDGDSTAIADQLEAAANGVSVDEVRTARESAERQSQEMAALRSELEMYRPLAVEQFKSSLLAEVKAVYPDVTAKSVDEFGDEFTKLVASGVSPAHAYAATKDVADRNTKPVPKEIGVVNSKGAGESDFFTKEEVAKMSKSEVKKNFAKIRESMTKW